jgi:DMSO/TMAO reductase YedYZ molybdopterin-dependent catalytic subunit
VTLNIDDLKRLPNVTITADFHCVTSWTRCWTRFDNAWRGVGGSVALAKPKRSGRFVTQTAFSGHTTSTPISDLLGDDALIAWEHDGKELALEHGAPIRIVLPKKYAYKGVKWLIRLTVTKDEERGFWEECSYSQSADPWKEERHG